VPTISSDNQVSSEDLTVGSLDAGSVEVVLNDSLVVENLDARFPCCV